jgi:Cu-Zn family superoxide dismutase
MYITSTFCGGTTVEIAALCLNSSWPHGIHIHQMGNLCDVVAGTSAGAHYNPHAAAHGCARSGQSGESGERKIGDLGNMLVDTDGNGYYAEAGNMLLTLEGPSSVIGRALVLHALPDNCVAEEGAAGDLSAGARIGMCTIGIDAPSTERTAHRRQIQRAYDLLGSGGTPPPEELQTAPSPAPAATVIATVAASPVAIADGFGWAHIILGFAVGGVAGLMVGRGQVRQGISCTKAETSED